VRSLEAQAHVAGLGRERYALRLATLTWGNALIDQIHANHQSRPVRHRQTVLILKRHIFFSRLFPTHVIKYGRFLNDGGSSN